MSNVYRKRWQGARGKEVINLLPIAHRLLPIAHIYTSHVSRLVAFFLIAHCSLLITPSDLQAARPLLTEDAVVAGKGVTQLEAGIEYAKIKDTGEGTTLVASPIHGVTEDTEFSLKVPYIFARPDASVQTDGWGDVSFIMKHLLADESDNVPAMLLKMSVKLPSGDKDRGLGTGDTNLGFLAALTKNLGPATLHLNAGYTFVGNQDEGRYNNEVNYGIAGEYEIIKKIRVAGEIYGLYHPEYMAKEIERRALLGLTYRLNDTFTIDIAGKRGLEGASDEYGIIGGITVTF